MTHKEKRERMDNAIKEILIPFLRMNNFKGSFPHFRREKNGELNLLSFQFSLYSPQFVVEIANCPLNGFTNYLGHEVKPAKCRVYNHGKRFRIGSLKNRTDYWYDFEYGSESPDIFQYRANEVIENWKEAENWWNTNPPLNSK